MRDIRAAGLCKDGLQDWLTLHGLNMRAFVRGQYTDELADSIGCEMGRRVAEAARNRVRAANVVE